MSHADPPGGSEPPSGSDPDWGPPGDDRDQIVHIRAKIHQLQQALDEPPDSDEERPACR